MTMKTILACVSSAESGRSALETAKRIALRFDSHVEALHVRADPRGLVPYTGEGMDGSMIEEIMEVTEREGGDRAVKTRQMFDDFCTSNGLTIAETPGAVSGPTIAWREETGREDEIVALRGRLFDIVVVGRPMRDAALPSPITLEAALLDTGRPIVIAPPAAPAEVGRSVAIAWESSPEAARAFAVSLPLLAQADTVTLLAPEPVEPPVIQAEEAIARLAWNGISANVQKFSISNLEIGAAFLDQAQQAGADILIKGAYAHSRLRQMILGGRTRHIITNTEIPVLLAH
jgi:nucleotide-binding universal stress UspA family protein